MKPLAVAKEQKEVLLALQACREGAKKKVMQVSILASTPCYVKLMQVFYADKASSG